MIYISGLISLCLFQPAELEIMELKEYTLFDEHGKVYAHYNFVVKDSDGTLTLFFAELDLNCFSLL